MMIDSLLLRAASVLFPDRCGSPHKKKENKKKDLRNPGDSTSNNTSSSNNNNSCSSIRSCIPPSPPINPSSNHRTMTTTEEPTNPLVGALLTDLYQLTMVYAHWKTGRVHEPSVFELFFRKHPFGGNHTVFCGLSECLGFLRAFRFSPGDLAYLRSLPSFANCEDGFFGYLASLRGLPGGGDDGHDDDGPSLRVSAVREGTLVVPRCPLITVEGPLGICQLLETALLNLVNYPSLVATNASRMAQRAGPRPCFEFGLRRAQGPDGAVSASRYSYLGGFAGTSNVRAGREFGIPLVGTMAHAYVQSWADATATSSTATRLFHKTEGTDRDFLAAALAHRDNSGGGDTGGCHDGELVAFCAYACAFPDGCLCLIDTYDTVRSGLENFVAVARALVDFGYTPRGVRLDSGDLVGLSRACRDRFRSAASEETKYESLAGMAVVASNDINEAALAEFAKTDHGMTAYGIGTHLVTCQAQPALGCVYKLGEFSIQNGCRFCFC